MSEAVLVQNDNRFSPDAPGRRIHVLGYCIMAEKLRTNVRRVVHPYEAIEPHPELKWQWIEGLCEVCRNMGDVLLFNRCIEERNLIASGREPIERRDARKSRRLWCFMTERDKAKETIDELEAKLTVARHKISRCRIKSVNRLDKLNALVEKYEQKLGYAVVAHSRAVVEYNEEIERWASR